MVLEKFYFSALFSLDDKKTIEMKEKGLMISLEADPQKNTLSLSTPIFSEKFYLPLSIRKYCYFLNIMNMDTLFPYFYFDKKNVSMSFCQKVPLISLSQLKNILSTFVDQALRWSKILREMSLYS